MNVPHHRAAGYLPGVSGLRHVGKHPDLSQKAHRVGELPLLLDLARLAAADRAAAEHDLAPGGRRAHQVTLVPSADRGASRDIVAFAELVIDPHPEVREAPTVLLDHLR